MSNIDTQLLEYMNEKRAKLIKQKRTSYLAANAIKWSLIILNLVTIILAIIALSIGLQIWYSRSEAAANASFFGVLGFTIILASFIVGTFFITLFLAVYKEVMKFKDYKKAIREITYITYKLEEQEEYTQMQFDKDFAEIQEHYLSKKNVKKSQIIKKFFLGGGK